MGSEEDEEPLEAETPRVRMNPKNPTNREQQEHEDSGHAVLRSWWTTSAIFDTGKRRRVSNFDVSRQQVRSNGNPQHTPFHFLQVSS